MPVLQIRKEIGEVTELIPEECVSECIAEEITDVRVHDDEPVSVMPNEFDGGKLESTTKDGSDLGDEYEEYRLEELRVIIVEGDAEYIKKVMNVVKVTKSVVGAIQVGQNPRPVCLTEGVCFCFTCQYRLSSAVAVQQIRVGALSPMPSCLGSQYTGGLNE